MRVPGSLRAEGLTRIAVDKPTRSKLHELAGDMPVSQYLRLLAHGKIKPPEDSGDSAQEPLLGQERMVSPATIHSVAADMAALKASYNGLELLISDIARFLGMPRLNTGLLRPKVQDEAGSMPAFDSSQMELLH